jgi:hypothetical protein
VAIAVGDAWVKTLADDVLETFQQSPDGTIVPAELRDSGGSRALALLKELSTSSATMSLHLKRGDVLGEGGMGVVRSAEQVALGRIVAVKTLKDDRRHDAASALDLLREAWVTGTVEHPNVVPVHYLGAEPDGTPLIVMKRIEGVEWSKLRNDAAEVKRRFGATDLLAWNLGILMQALNALRFAHHRGIVHRDLKPANVMIGDFGEVYLLDWGIAVALRDDGSGRLPLVGQANALAGTPCYMAPEMLGRETGPPISERTDVYLAGAVLFELVVGKPPHAGASAIEVIASVIESKPVVPSSAPVELARIVTKAMHCEPEERYESVEALRIELQRYLEHRGSAEIGARALERTDQLVAALAKGNVDREEIYRMFGACRFGFHESLAIWRDNAEAKAGLARATIAVAELELASGHPGSAVTLLSDLDDPPPLLARAKHAAAEQVRRDSAAKELLESNNPLPGRRTRTFLVLVLGTIFTFVPLLAALRPDIAGFTLKNHVVFSVLTCAGVGFLVWWARDTMTATVLNRRVAAASIFMFAAEAWLVGGFWIAGSSAYTAQLGVAFLWGTCAAWLAITLDVWFVPSALGYFTAFLIAARWPWTQLYVTSGANFVFTVNLIARWRPATWKQSPEERAWLERRTQIRHDRDRV